MMLLTLALISAAPMHMLPTTNSLTASAIEPDTASLEEARRLIKATRVEDTLDQMFTALSPVFSQSVVGALSGSEQGKALLANLDHKPGTQQRLLALLSSEYLAAIKRRVPDILEELAREYASRFTLEELRTINAFYATGAGGKLISTQSALQQAMAEIGKAAGEKAGREAAEKAFDKLEAELGPQHPKSGT